MFDVGWQEIFIVAAIAIIVVGPKDLPRVLRTVANLVKKARKMVGDFQSGIDEVIREAGIDDIREKVKSGANLDIGGEIKRIIDPEGDISNKIDMGDIERELDAAGSSVAIGPGNAPASDTDAAPSDAAPATDTAPADATPVDADVAPASDAAPADATPVDADVAPASDAAPADATPVDADVAPASDAVPYSPDKING